MKNQIKIVFVFSLILTLLPHCKNKDCHEDGTCAADYRKLWLGEAKAYLLAKPNSYWIYKNTTTNELDTQICTAFLMDTIIKRGTRNDTKHITVEYERLRRFIQSSYNKWEYYDETAKYNPDAIRENKTGVDRYVFSGDAGINFPFFYPFNKDERIGNTQCKGMDTTLIIQGKTYAKVVQFEINNDGIWERKLNCIRSTNTYYWAKDVGLIKKEMKTCNMSWELIEYNIIK